MLEINIIIAAISIICIGWALYKGYLLNKKRIYLTKIGDELNKAIIEMKRLISSRPSLFPKGDSKGSGLQDIVDPSILSTLITVIVKKYGNLHVGVADFIVVKDEEYVSVYVDTSTNDIILSLDHETSQKNFITMANFTDSDDSTYH